MVFWSSVDIIGWELCFLFVLVQAELIDHVARSDRLCFTDLVLNTIAVPLLFQTLSQFHFWGEQPFCRVDKCIFPKFSRDDNTSFRYYNIQILVETALPAQIISVFPLL